MDRNLALEFARVCEAAALSSAMWMGKGEKKKADGAAVEMMRKTLNDINFNGTVIIGEGEKDKAPMLFSGEQVGKNNTKDKERHIDLAIDPLEGTSLVAHGKPEAISVIAAGPAGSFMKAPGTYMEQLAVGKKAVGTIDINDSVANNLKRISEALGKDVSELTVCILDRPRLQNKIKEIRDAGARIKLIEHGTVMGGLAAGIEDSGVDVMMGDGGAPEAVILAAGLKCIGGEIQAKIKPHDEKTEKEAKELGLNKNEVYTTDDLAKGNDLMFVATGVSHGSVLRGVLFKDYGAKTHSLIMKSSSGTLRFLETDHYFEGQPKY